MDLLLAILRRNLWPLLPVSSILFDGVQRLIESRPLVDPRPPPQPGVTYVNDHETWQIGHVLAVLGPRSLRVRLRWRHAQHLVHDIAAVTTLDGTVWLALEDGRTLNLGPTGLDRGDAARWASALNDAVWARKRGGQSDRDAMEHALTAARPLPRAS